MDEILADFQMVSDRERGRSVFIIGEINAMSF